MISFGYSKHKQKTLNFTWQPFGPQVYFESKLILIQRLDEKDWIKHY